MAAALVVVADMVAKEVAMVVAEARRWYRWLHTFKRSHMKLTCRVLGHLLIRSLTYLHASPCSLHPRTLLNSFACLLTLSRANEIGKIKKGDTVILWRRRRWWKAGSGGGGSSSEKEAFEKALRWRR